jgi:myosin-7
LEKVLCCKTTVIRGNVITSPLSKEAARDVRDTLAKGLYESQFIWIFKRVNDTLKQPTDDREKHKKLSIGMLDVFGFEVFKTNSFEQLCINYCNETLQQFYLNHVFKLEQNRCASEGMQLEHIDFQDNKETLDLLANQRLSIIDHIDEEIKVPKGTDASLLEKLNSNHSSNPHYLADKLHTFGICHFTGSLLSCMHIYVASIQSEKMCAQLSLAVTVFTLHFAIHALAVTIQPVDIY